MYAWKNIKKHEKIPNNTELQIKKRNKKPLQKSKGAFSFKLPPLLCWIAKKLFLAFFVLMPHKQIYQILQIHKHYT